MSRQQSRSRPPLYTQSRRPIQTRLTYGIPGVAPHLLKDGSMAYHAISARSPQPREAHRF